MTLAYALAIVTIASFYTIVFVRMARFRRRLPTLREWNGPEPSTWPRLSVIVPCRNEAENVRQAVSTLLAQDYPDLQIVAIDDRSTDATGAILDTLASSNPRLRVHHITELPAGWLGKNNAMHEGARVATGEWLLFTDGDVMFEPSALRRSIAFAIAHRLGHFVAMPHFRAEGFLERGFVAAFAVAFAVATDPTRLSIPGSFSFVGVGAFGLVRRDEYERIGGHERIAFEVGDDVKLGLVLRRSGVAQGCLDSDGLVSLRWQQGFIASLRGLEKNAFAGFEWSTPLAAIAVVMFLTAIVLPYAPLFADLPAWLDAVAAYVALLQIALVTLTSRRLTGGTGLEGALTPMMGLCLAGVVTWSAALTLARGGILWRGTFYPLGELRARCVRVMSFDRHNGVGWTPPPPPLR